MSARHHSHLCETIRNSTDMVCKHYRVVGVLEVRVTNSVHLKCSDCQRPLQTERCSRLHPDRRSSHISMAGVGGGEWTRKDFSLFYNGANWSFDERIWCRKFKKENSKPVTLSQWSLRPGNKCSWFWQLNLLLEDGDIVLARAWTIK